MKRDEWTWMPHPAHFICSIDCRFVLATEVGGYIVSTVGEYLPDAPVREIEAEARGVKLRGRGDARLRDFLDRVGYMEVGGRIYETMVFRSEPSDNPCCPFRISGDELEADGYNDAGAARAGHLAKCEKWAAIPPEEREP